VNINPIILDDLKNFDWESVLKVGNRLSDLNDRQWRFVKGLTAELSVEKASGENGFIYVGENGKDFVWQKHNLDVELKSQFADTMYTKKGELRSRYVVKLNNSNGTNKKEFLTKNDVATIIIVVRKDGAFVVGRDMALENTKKYGDGFELIIPKEHVIELSGRIIVEPQDILNIREEVIARIKDLI
jgi:hypothetical protein